MPRTEARETARNVLSALFDLSAIEDRPRLSTRAFSVVLLGGLRSRDERGILSERDVRLNDLQWPEYSPSQTRHACIYVSGASTDSTERGA